MGAVVEGETSCGQLRKKTSGLGPVGRQQELSDGLWNAKMIGSIMNMGEWVKVDNDAAGISREQWVGKMRHLHHETHVELSGRDISREEVTALVNSARRSETTG